MSEHANLRLMVFWLRRIIAFTLIIDRLNMGAGERKVISAVTEGIRRAVNEAEGYISEQTPTEEIPAVVEWSEAS